MLRIKDEAWKEYIQNQQPVCAGYDFVGNKRQSDISR